MKTITIMLAIVVAITLLAQDVYDDNGNYYSLEPTNDYSNDLELYNYNTGEYTYIHQDPYYPAISEPPRESDYEPNQFYPKAYHAD